MVLPTCKGTAEIQSQVRFPLRKEKRNQRNRAWMQPVYDVALFFFYIPTDLQGGLATAGSAPLSAASGASLPLVCVPCSVWMSPLETSTGVGGQEQC